MFFHFHLRTFKKVLARSAILVLILLQILPLFPLHTAAATNTWDLSSSSDYSFDSSKIEFSDGQAQLKATTSPAWYDSSYKFRRAITIDNTGNSSSQTDYSIKVSLTSANFDFDQAETDGSDLRVTGPDGTTLIPYYIESYDADAQTATVWFKLQSLGGSSVATVYLYYGNPSPVAFDLPPIGPFEKYDSNPIIPGGGLPENVVYDEATGLYWLVYQNNSNVILVSSSTDLLSWNSPGAQIITDVSGSSAPHLSYYNNVYYLYYSYENTTTNIRLATSSSITGPYRVASSTILSVGASGSWEDVRVLEPYVFQKDANTWIMMYMGDSGGNTEQVGYATASAPDGVWTKSPLNPVLAFGESKSYDAGTIADPFVYKFGNTYYIYYAASPTNSLPWQIAYATTTDFLTFSKKNVVLGYGSVGDSDESNSHRGALIKVGDYYYLPYTGRTSNYVIDMARMYAKSTAQGYPADQVFGFYDDFSGTSLKDHFRVNGGTGGSYTLADGILTLKSGTGTYNQALSIQEFSGSGWMMEARTKHPNADGTGNHAGELGFADSGRSSYVRIADYNSSFWKKSTGGTFQDMAQAIDTDWHVHRVWWKTPTTALYQNDNNTWETRTTGTPTGTIPAWLFSFATSGNTTDLLADYIIVRKYADPEPTASVGARTGSYSADNPSVQPDSSSAVEFTSADSFNNSVSGSGSVTYQISNDAGTTWYWYDEGWVETTASSSESSNAATISTHLSTFPTGDGQFLWRAFLNSDGSQQIQLNSVTFESDTDTDAPAISAGSPSGQLPAGTTETTLSVTTDENAACRYDTAADTDFGSMASDFTVTGTTSPTTVHTTTLSGLTDGSSYSYYVRCEDAAGNANSSDYTVSFSVASAAVDDEDDEDEEVSDDEVKIPTRSRRGVPLHVSTPVLISPIPSATPVSSTVPNTLPAVPVSAAHLLDHPLYLGLTDPDVRTLQMILNTTAETAVATSGAGSPGHETDYFGALTFAAVKRFQVKYGISSAADPAFGYVGPRTRAKLNELIQK